MANTVQISGSFKNALDWLILLAERDPPYLTNKPAGLVTTAELPENASTNIRDGEMRV